MHDAFSSSLGQGWPQLADLALAFVLTSLIGLERRAKRKSAGLRTHALVGLGAALFMLVSKYGFADLMDADNVSFDPSRIAAQVVSGVGFLGGGLIFVRRDVVRGLTTAAIVWVSAAVGMACGAGLPLLALAVVALHFLTVWGFTKLGEHLPDVEPSRLLLTYEEGRGVLRTALGHCTERGFAVTETQATQDARDARATQDGVGDDVARAPRTRLTLAVAGEGSVPELVAELIEIPGMLAVNARQPGMSGE
ncbi:MgtC/SapB family protein [Streptomyces diacarni]|uniref:MgtC/SapB family protein n=1 Tax=Streptomyces diacarni TaxID=2800381 RepID=UPI0033F26B42